MQNEKTQNEKTQADVRHVRAENLAAGPVLDWLIARDVLGARAISPEQNGTGYIVEQADGSTCRLPYYSSDETLQEMLQQRERVEVCEINAGEFYATADACGNRPPVRAFGLTAAEAVACCVVIRYSGSWCSVPRPLWPEINGDD